MSEPHNADDGPGAAMIAELRSLVAQSPQGSYLWRCRSAELAAALLDSAGGPDSGADAVGTLRGLAEPESLIDNLRATGPGSGEYRRLCVLSAHAAAIRYGITDSPEDLDTLIGWWERAAAAFAPDEDLAADDPWWEYADSGYARGELALNLVSRWSLAPAGDRRPDADRIVGLLTPLLDGSDGVAAEDPAYCHGCLGLVLSDRWRGPDHADPERLADRAAALVHLRAAHTDGELAPWLRSLVAFDLAMLSFCDWSDRRDADPDAYGPERVAAELGPLLDLLRPLLDDREEEGGRAAELGGDIAEALCAYAVGEPAQRVAYDWYRDALAHPALDPAAGIEIGVSLGLALAERAERNSGARTPGEPDPGTDRAEALDLLDGLVDAMEPDEGRLSCLTAVMELLWQRLDGPDHASVLDRFITRGMEFIALIDLNDEDRALETLRVGLALGRRVHAQALPYVQVLSNRLTTGDDTGGVPSFDSRLPGVAAELRTAVELLRTGTGLYHYDNDLYLRSVLALGILQVMEFAVRLPEVRIGQLHEGMRRLRAALERLPAGSELRGDDFTGIFLLGTMYTVWYSAPFNAAHADHGTPGIPDVTGFASVEDDLQLLDGLLDAQKDEREPGYDLLRALLIVLRSPGGLPPAGELRIWQVRLRHAADLTEPDSSTHRAVLLALSGAFGLELARRGQASATESAAATAALYEARDVAPPETPLRARIDGMLGTVGRPDLFSLVRGFFDADPAPRPDPATRPDPAIRPDPPAPLADEAVGGGGSDADQGVPAVLGDRSEAPEFDLRAAVLVGDGSPDPFAVPAGRAIELLSGGPGEPSAPTLVVLAMIRYRRWLQERDGSDLVAAVGMVRKAAAVLTAGRPRSALAGRLAALQAGMLLDRHLLLGDHTDLEAADGMYRTLLRQVPPRVRPPALPTLLAEAADPDERDGLRGLFLPPTGEVGSFRAELLAAAGTTGPLLARLREPHQDREAVPLALEHLREAERTLPHGHHRLPSVRGELGRYAVERARTDGDRAARRAAEAALFAGAASCPPDHPHRTALLLRAAAALCPACGDTGPTAPADEDAARLDKAVALLRQAAEEGRYGYQGAGARCLYGIGLLLYTRHRRSGEPADLDAAATALQEARLALEPSRGDAFSIILTRALALVYRAYGERDDTRRRSRETAKSVLAAHGRSVLLQTGAHRGLDAARAVGADMSRLVRWCLADGLPESAVEAVELGRGLVLNAATVNATVPDLLRTSGQPGLAAEWETNTPADRGDGPVAVPDGLRRRVLEALTGSPAEQRLLSAPTPAEVGRALRRVGADALAHLVPGEDGPGHALVVTATGVVHHLELPGLSGLDGGPLGAYNSALRDFQSAGRPERQPARTDPPVLHTLHRRELAKKEEHWKQCLAALSDWAGTAVMDELIDRAEKWWPGRLPRLVLAPVGGLGVVPWHAARSSGRTGAARYAVQRAEVSYCATARQLLEVAARPRTPLDTGTTLLVVDPAGSAAMHREARLVRSRFHPEAVVVGDLGWDTTRHGPWTGPPPLPATRAAIGPYLPGRGATSAALSHINCHADTGLTAADSVLKLDRANPLTVADLLAGPHHRDSGAPGGVVVLANCTSDLALSDHDEALTLSTAMLAAGAATVVGSRWAILDDPRTTLLMCLFHHRLKEGALPREALRAAQLWMLDPGRTVPSGLADIAAAVPDDPESPWDELEIWASFTHHGR